MPLDHEVNSGTIAPLRNVTLFNEVVKRVVNRPRHLPGMATFHGFSGYGKTFSATYAANKFRAYYVEVGESWTKAKFCKSLMIELGLQPKGTVADMVDAIINQLVVTDRPVIIDEFDHVVRRRYHETIREIHDKSGAPMVLIGEEMLPQQLAASERFHNRMLDWVPAVPADVTDAIALAELYAPEIAIADDLIDHIARQAGGRVRRICVNLEKVRETARSEGWGSVDLKAWGDRPLFSGQPPARRG
ncbi:AAA family ATPase [Rhodospirillum centenum]|uniref:Phage transposition protein B n=1 Tax=Rhodospirillum centenum (strain ATCC 51521 / SW) TaxID=414684 RepID=B6ISS3_RHOCS|nr:AAA family ATPase [Rhodospirillum centenum]ACI98509.1 phage transposition protein B [Rhodospirillum centenum SW]